MSYADDFLQGARDCKDGKPHEAGKSEAYDDGYGAQYSSEQMLTEMGIRNEHHG